MKSSNTIGELPGTNFKDMTKYRKALRKMPKSGLSVWNKRSKTIKQK